MEWSVATVGCLVSYIPVHSTIDINEKVFTIYYKCDNSQWELFDHISDQLLSL